MDGSFTRVGALPRLPDLILRALIASVLVTGTLAVFAGPLADRLIPVMLLQNEIQLLAPDFKIQSAGIHNEGSTELFHFNAYVSRPIQIGNDTLVPSDWLGVGPKSVLTYTLPLRVLEYWAITLIIILAWPFAGIREFLSRCVVSIPLMFIEVSVALPSQALAALWKETRSEMEVPGVSGWQLWSSSVMDGGGLVLGCAVGALAIFLARCSMRRRAMTIPRSLADSRVLNWASTEPPSPDDASQSDDANAVKCRTDTKLRVLSVV